MKVYQKKVKMMIKNAALITLVLFMSCQSEKESNTSGARQKITIEDVEKGIRENIDARVKEGNGYFTYQKDTFDLKLKLVRVHTEFLSILGPNEFFACVDLATENGDVYDVDFFMEGQAGQMKVTRTNIHKLNGKPYYTWKQSEEKTWYTVPVKNASKDLLGVIEDKDRFRFTYKITLPQLAEKSQIWIPIAQNDQFQSIEILSVKTPVKENTIIDEVYGNRMMHVMLNPEHSGQDISVTYKVHRMEKGPYTKENTDTLRYLGASALLPVNDRFAVIAEEVISDRAANSPLTKARALYDYIIDNMRYAKEGKYGTGDANYACDAKSGNCTEFHSFFISLARSAGIPARFAVGAAIPSERNYGGVNGYHCWAEFYAEGKWWPVDISEANKYTPLATYYFGHHPANRIEFSRGRDIKPSPMPESGAINFLAYPVLEVGGKPASVKTTFTFNRLVEGS